MNMTTRLMCCTCWTLALMLSACSGKDEILLSDYNTNCATDAECVAIQIGKYVGCACGYSCTWGAVNRADYPTYKDDVANIKCKSYESVCAGCVQTPTAYCTAGTCVVGSPPVNNDAGLADSEAGAGSD
jgi:hypothetical protein